MLTKAPNSPTLLILVSRLLDGVVAVADDEDERGAVALDGDHQFVEAEAAGARRVQFLDLFLVQNFVAVESEEEEESRTQDFGVLEGEVGQDKLLLLLEQPQEGFLAEGGGEGNAGLESSGYPT